MKKEIITIQHAESEQHLNGMVGGWTDWPLTERGCRQADAIGQGLQTRLCNDVKYIMYSSDLIRTRQTAEHAGAPVGLKPILRRELREIYFGSATSKSMEWLNEHALSREPDQSILHYRKLSDAESLYDVYLRVKPFVEELLTSPDEHIIVVSHCAALGMFISCCMGIDMMEMPCAQFMGAAAGVSRLTWDDDGVSLCYFNDVSDWKGI